MVGHIALTMLRLQDSETDVIRLALKAKAKLLLRRFGSHNQRIDLRQSR